MGISHNFSVCPAPSKSLLFSEAAFLLSNKRWYSRLLAHRFLTATGHALLHQIASALSPVPCVSRKLLSRNPASSPLDTPKHRISAECRKAFREFFSLGPREQAQNIRNQWERNVRYSIADMLLSRADSGQSGGPRSGKSGSAARLWPKRERPGCNQPGRRKSRIMVWTRTGPMCKGHHRTKVELVLLSGHEWTLVPSIAIYVPLTHDSSPVNLVLCGHEWYTKLALFCQACLRLTNCLSCFTCTRILTEVRNLSASFPEALWAWWFNFSCVSLNSAEQTLPPRHRVIPWQIRY